MKKLTMILLRHGKAEREGESDHGRELADRGREQSLSVGKNLKKIYGHIDRAIVSDATRTRQTVAEVLTQVPIHAVLFEPRLYFINNHSEFLEAVSPKIIADDKTLLIVGHNPTISQIASFYTEHDIDLGTGEYVIATAEFADWQSALVASGGWTLK